MTIENQAQDIKAKDNAAELALDIIKVWLDGKEPYTRIG